MTAKIRVAELFAGVGGFRLGLTQASRLFQVTFANQWEPGSRTQFAAECYARHFEGGIVNASETFNMDIERVLDKAESDPELLGPFDLVVGGFPCQDYSVAKPKNLSRGLQGKKGVLWWQIYRLLELQKNNPPRWVLLENVDRLLSSPASQRGRDFGIILHCLSSLGYDVEWRVINAADFGFPQKRRRVFLLASRRTRKTANPASVVFRSSALAKAFPIDKKASRALPTAVINLPESIQTLSDTFGSGNAKSPFMNAGVVQGLKVTTFKVVPQSPRKRTTLGDILEPIETVPDEYFVRDADLPKWKRAKGGKKTPRVNRFTGETYEFKEGAIPFPDDLLRPARTILTSEGGPTPTRSKHIVLQDGRYRRLLPVELERLNGFSNGWTEGMTPSQRAFCMGNALVVGLVKRIGRQLIAAPK
jgi:DNA (cytosine-5)-methyltransferase 1